MILSVSSILKIPNSPSTNSLKMNFSTQMKVYWKSRNGINKTIYQSHILSIPKTNLPTTIDKEFQINSINRNNNKLKTYLVLESSMLMIFLMIITCEWIKSKNYLGKTTIIMILVDQIVLNKHQIHSCSWIKLKKSNSTNLLKATKRPSEKN